jgi:Tol biopolymer transport system component/DNA-binding winged helix-turn-helix (wHTH) protein
MAEQAQNTVVRFGVFEVNLRSGELRKHGLRLRIPGQPFKILALLLERPGEAVTREELQKNLWPDDTFVDFEHSLNSAIKKLRAALGDSAESSRYIETLPRLGYRFIAPVDASEPPFVAAVHERGSPQPASADQGLYDAQKFAINPGLGLRSALVFAVLLATIAAAAFLSVSLRRTRALPFETTTTTRLTSDGESLKAAISPDGRYVAHTLIRSGQESLQVRRATMLHDSEIVPPGPVHYLGVTFSPDNEIVYYVTRTVEAAPAVLYRVPVMGGSAQKMKEGLDSPITFSPDGTKFAFVRESAGQSTLMVADLDSGREHRLISRKLPEVLDYPAWSPDGRIIACTAVDSSTASPRGSDAQIIEVGVLDSAERPLSGQTWGFIRQLAWFSDGHGLVMSARGQESGFFQVWYVAYPGGFGRKLTDGLNNRTGASVSADSRRIVTVEESTFSGIWRMRSMQAHDPEPVVSGSHGSSTPLWTPDGRIVFEQELNGHRSIWIADADGTNLKQLTLAGNNYDPSVSGDGRILAYGSDRTGSPAIWTMALDGGSPAMVVKARAEAMPQFSPDGKWIAYTEIGSGHWPTLWRVASNGGRATELSDRLWLRPAISPDGKWIAGFYADHQLNTQTEPASIAVIGIDGGQPSTVIPIPPSASISAGIRWTPDGRQLTYVDRGKDGDNVWSQPLNGGAPHQATQFHGDALFGFDWSQDGEQLVFSRGIRARDVVLIQDARQK